MTRQPDALASWSAQTETPPEPSTSTVSPGRTGRPTPNRQFQAVTPAQGRQAPSSKL